MGLIRWVPSQIADMAKWVTLGTTAQVSRYLVLGEARELFQSHE
jgi:hypothetical protein